MIQQNLFDSPETIIDPPKDSPKDPPKTAIDFQKTTINPPKTAIPDQPAPYTIIRSKRRSITITVFPDTRVEIKAPLYVTLKSIHELVESKKKWIRKKQEQFKNSLSYRPPLQYRSGEGHLFMGKTYTLKVQITARTKVILKENTLYVGIKDSKNQKALVKAAIEKWYRKNAEKLFKQRIHIGLDLLKKYKLSEPALKIRKMTSRWGSCSTKKVVTLNLELIKYPLDCIDYVVVHELSHMVYHNHSKKFYEVLASALPDWKKRKKKLDHGGDFKE